jgi:hypothetical protein
MRQVLGFPRKPASAAAPSERPPRAAVLPPDVVELRDELSALLLELDEAQARTWRHLVVVHDELGARGWPGVEALPVRVLRKARVQAEMLASREPSPTLADLVERLELVEVAAAVRDGEAPPAEPARPPEEELAEMSRFVEVSDTSFEEYELMERSWVGTVPSGLGKPGRENWGADAAPSAGQAEAPPTLDLSAAPLLVETLEMPVLVEKPQAPVLVESFQSPVFVDSLEAPVLVESFDPPLLVETVEPPRRDPKSPSAAEHWVDFDRD